MNVGSVTFRWIVTQVFLSGLIKKIEVFLCFSVKKPEVTHLHGSGALAFDCVNDDADCGGVVYVNRRW